MSFRLKTILGIALIEALLLSILIVSGLHYLSSSNEQQLLQRANTTAKLVATMTGDAVVAVDLATLDALVEQTLRNPDIVYLRIRSAKGMPLSQGGADAALAEPFQQDLSVDSTSNDQRLDVAAPITVGGTAFGQVELGISTAALQSTMTNAFTWMAGIALSEMLLVALLGLVLGTYLTRQLQLLKTGAREVAGGAFGHQIPVRGNDELADTAISFNRMSQSLREYADLAERARQKAEAGRERAESTLQDALDSMRDGVLIIDRNEKIVLVNEAYRNLYDIAETDTDELQAIVRRQADLLDGDPETSAANRLAQFRDPGNHARWETRLSDGRHLLVAQHAMSRGGVVVVETDVTELYDALEENRQLQMELMQAHKTEALGTLAGGMAHEINTPVQFISDNVSFLAEGVSDVISMIEDLAADNKPGSVAIEDRLHSRLKEIDWTFLRDEIPGALDEMSKGTARVRDLISTFKQFAAPTSQENEYEDLVEAVRTVIDVSKPDWQDKADVHLEAPSAMPRVPCKLVQINQAVQSLISNAADAIEDCADARKGVVTVRLGADSDAAWIEVRDNGCGIPAKDQQRIFDALFTTKDPGRGTGHGLALCHTIVTRNHGGSLTFDSSEGEGTTFKISLPLKIAADTVRSSELAVAS